MDEITVTRATEEQETKVENMAILFYNANQPNSTPIIVKVRNLGEPTRRNSNTNWLYTIELNEDQLTVGDRKVTSGEWYMYPIANYDKYTSSIWMNWRGRRSPSSGTTLSPPLDVTSPPRQC